MTKRTQSGLSLLELLVVFVLVSMISTVLVQGFGYGLSVYDRVESGGQQLVIDVLSAKWFRLVNSALVPLNSREQSLVGGSEQFEAMTMNPLLDSYGQSTRVSWQIVHDVLVYRQGDGELEVLRLPRGAVFRYLNVAGDWVDSWPTDQNTYELPVAVRIDSGTETLLTASVRNRLVPNFLLEESRRER